MWGIFGWLLFGGMAAVEGTKDANYRADEYKKATTNKEPYFYDRKGRTFLTSNPRIQVTYSTQYHLDTKKCVNLTRRVLRNVNTFQVVYVYPNYYYDTIRERSYNEEEAKKLLGCDPRYVDWS